MFARFVAVLLLMVGACNGSSSEVAEPVRTAASIGGYDFNRPVKVIELPEKLTEISGLTLADSLHLAAIQDELGIVFILDPDTGKILREISVAKRGDYEDLTAVGDVLFVLRSDGMLFRIANWLEESPQVQEIELPLAGGCDAEGLAFDSANDRLLISCKEGTRETGPDARAFYAYPVSGGSVETRPVFFIREQQLDSTILAFQPRTVEEKLIALVQEPPHPAGFKPGAIAIHPVNGRIFVISSVSKAMALLSPNGMLESIVTLPPDYFLQPEGMVFLPNGDLLISNEGNNGPATLLRFAFTGASGDSLSVSPGTPPA